MPLVGGERWLNVRCSEITNLNITVPAFAMRLYRSQFVSG